MVPWYHRNTAQVGGWQSGGTLKKPTQDKVSNRASWIHPQALSSALPGQPIRRRRTRRNLFTKRNCHEPCCHNTTPSTWEICWPGQWAYNHCNWETRLLQARLSSPGPISSGWPKAPREQNFHKKLPNVCNQKGLSAHYQIRFIVYSFITQRSHCQLADWRTPENASFHHLALQHCFLHPSDKKTDFALFALFCAVCYITRCYAIVYHGLTITSRDTMVYHGVPWYTIPWHGVPWYTMGYHGMPWYLRYIMVYHSTPWHTMVYHGVQWYANGIPMGTYGIPYGCRGMPWYTMVYTGIPWYTMVYYGLPWSTTV